MVEISSAVSRTSVWWYPVFLSGFFLIGNKTAFAVNVLAAVEDRTNRPTAGYGQTLTVGLLAMLMSQVNTTHSNDSTSNKKSITI